MRHQKKPATNQPPRQIPIKGYEGTFTATLNPNNDPTPGYYHVEVHFYNSVQEIHVRHQNATLTDRVRAAVEQLRLYGEHKVPMRFFANTENGDLGAILVMVKGFFDTRASYTEIVQQVRDLGVVVKEDSKFTQAVKEVLWEQ